MSGVRGSQMAAKITGRFSVCDSTFRFSAIAFGRIGGQNIGASVSRAVQKRLKAMGLDPDEVVMELQRMLLQGEITIPEGVNRESFADGR